MLSIRLFRPRLFLKFTFKPPECSVPFAYACRCVCVCVCIRIYLCACSGKMNASHAFGNFQEANILFSFLISSCFVKWSRSSIALHVIFSQSISLFSSLSSCEWFWFILILSAFRSFDSKFRSTYFCSSYHFACELLYLFLFDLFVRMFKIHFLLFPIRNSDCIRRILNSYVFLFLLLVCWLNIIMIYKRMLVSRFWKVHRFYVNSIVYDAHSNSRSHHQISSNHKIIWTKSRAQVV